VQVLDHTDGGGKKIRKPFTADTPQDAEYQALAWKTGRKKSVANAHGFLVSVLDMFMPDFKIKTRLPAKKKPILKK
jgi:hypothetical protein